MTVKNHGITEDIIKGVYEEAKDFFSLPLAIKMEVIASLSPRIPILILIQSCLDREQKYTNLQGLLPASEREQQS